MKAHLLRWAVVAPLALIGVAATGHGTPLIEAIKSGGDPAAVRVLVQRSAVNATEPDGTTALHWAVQRDDVAIVEMLIAAGADVKAANRYGVRPLSLAAENGNAAVLEQLLAAGADPNTRQFGGETALMTAARTGKVDAVRVLIAHGADVNAREQTRNQTALMWAAVNGNAASITELVKAGADLNARSTSPEKPKAARSLGSEGARGPGARAKGAGEPGKPGKVVALGEHEPKLQYGAYTALAFAVRRGQADAVRALLSAGASVNDRAVVHPDEGPTPVITLAVANGHYELAAYLLDRGADPNLAENGWTALHQLARARSEPGKTRTNVGWTTGPTMTGKISGIDLARKWIDKGGNVNARATKDFEDGYRHAEYINRVGATPLLMAARVCDYQLMQLLLDNGADPSLASDDGMTPLMAAAGNGIRSPNEDGGDEDAPQAVKVLLDALKQRGVDIKEAVNQPDVRGWTPLHGAAYRGNATVIQELVDAGAQLDARTYDAGRARTDLGLSDTGWMPVHIADGIVIGGIFFRQVGAAALLRKLMAERGLPVPPDEGLVRGTYEDNKADTRLLGKEKAPGPADKAPTDKTPSDKTPTDKTKKNPE